MIYSLQGIDFRLDKISAISKPERTMTGGQMLPYSFAVHIDCHAIELKFDSQKKADKEKTSLVEAWKECLKKATSPP